MGSSPTGPTRVLSQDIGMTPNPRQGSGSLVTGMLSRGALPRSPRGKEVADLLPGR